MREYGEPMRLRSMPERVSFPKFWHRKRRSLGVALGSGGAKGLAHLGALQAMSEEGIEFDVYAGTSAGSIVGALCACGYTPKDIVELLLRMGYGGAAVSSMLKGSLEPMQPVLDDVFGGREIQDLKKPFCAIATDASDGGEVVLREGNAARAVLASSSIPPLFRGIDWEGKRLVDGAFCNAIPGDAARKLGADIVIGIALSPVQSYRESVFVTSAGEQKILEQSGFAACDVLLEPDLSQYGAADIQMSMRMYDIGYACAQESMQKILRAVGRARAQHV